MEPKSNLDILPPEMITQFLMRLGPKDLANYCQTSKSAKVYCQNDHFWKDKYRYDYGPSMPVLTEGEKWIDIYKERKMARNTPISVGYNHYAIIDDRGILYMGGRGDNGQLGNGQDRYNKGNRRHICNKRPIPLRLFTHKIISVSCGQCFTIAITENGKSYGWGQNYFTNKIKGILNIPTKIEPLKNYKSIKVSCGRDGWGVILEGGSIFYSILYQYNIISGMILLKDGVIDISVNHTELAMVTRNGNLYYFGQYLGQKFEKAHKTGEIISIQPIYIPLPEKIRQVSISMGKIMVLSRKGTVYVLGCSETGLGLVVSRWMSAVTRKLTMLPKISYIDGSGWFSSAITADGKLYLWGDIRNIYSNDASWKFPNKMIELENSGYVDTKFPIEIDIGFKVNYVAIADEFIIATTDNGFINYWGNPEYGPN